MAALFLQALTMGLWAICGFLWPAGLMAANDWIAPPVVTEKGYPVPRADTIPEIPAAHGAHRAYAIEWWYWVGHLESEGGAEQFGFQSTVFRLAGEPTAAALETGAPFASGQLYMAHLGLSDLTAGTYRHHERVYREGWQAQAQTGQLGLRVGPIRAEESSEGTGFYKTLNYGDGIEVRLHLRPLKPMLVFGERGLSRKGANPAAVSWYWTYSRLAVEGWLVRDGVETAVSGTAWMDHEISSSQLGSELEGWDWTAIHLDDGTEVKAYRLRGKGGSSDPWSAVYWIDAAGGQHSVYADDFKWKEVGYWTSPATGLRYPSSVEIEARHPGDGEMRSYRLVPLLAEQEFVGNSGGNAYWEGACAVLDASGRPIGRAFLELAGYGGGLSGQLN